MKKNFFLFLILITFFLSFCTNSNQDSIKKLSWIEGEWIRTLDKEISVEKWKFIEPGKYEGFGTIINNGDTVFSENMYIEVINSKIVFIAIPSGKVATIFKLVSQEDYRVEFENPSHDFPQKITYWQENKETLNASIEGMINNSKKSFNYSWKRKNL